MSLRSTVRIMGCVGLSAILWSAIAGTGQAQQFGTPTGASSCNTCAPSHHCPPAYKHRYEGAPHIHWHHGCPHPICPPCELPHFGFYETCWSPFPFPPTWGHCLTPPPAAFVTLNPLVHPSIPGPRTPTNLPPSGGLTPPVATPPAPMPMPPGPASQELNFPQRSDSPR
jgi:hypothetical protein